MSCFFKLKAERNRRIVPNNSILFHICRKIFFFCIYEIKPNSEHGTDNVSDQEQGDAGNIERCLNGETGG